MGLAAVRTGIKAALAAVDGLNIVDYEAWRPQLPCAVVRLPVSMDTRPVFGRANIDFQLPVELRIGGTDLAADDRLEQLLDINGPAATSVLTALLTDPTFGGACGSSAVGDVIDFGWRQAEDGVILWLSATILVDVMT